MDEQIQKTGETGGGISRRTLLKSTAGAAVATLAGAAGARAQVTGLMPGGGKLPLRMPAGALDYLGRNEYVHNMTIHAYLPGVTFSSGEPLMVMWARGTQRLLPLLRFPRGTVPALVSDGRRVQTNRAIARFLDDRISERPVWHGTNDARFGGSVAASPGQEHESGNEYGTSGGTVTEHCEHGVSPPAVYREDGRAGGALHRHPGRVSGADFRRASSGTPTGEVWPSLRGVWNSCLRKSA